MSRLNWLPILAIVGLILADHVNAQALDEGSRGRPSAAQEQPQSQQGAPPVITPTVQNDIRRIAGALETANEKPPSEIDKRNAQAQQKVADYAPIMVGLGVVEIFITAVGVWLVRKTIIESRNATEDDIRPYVQVSRCKFAFSGGNKSRFEARVQNSGQTPATYFEINFSAIAVPVGADGAKWQMPDKLPNKHMWNAIGGGDTVTVGLYDPKLTKAIAEVGQGNRTLFVLGNVRYGDVWGNEYETQFAYWTHDVSQTWAGNTQTGMCVKPRKMRRATGELQTFRMTKKANEKSQNAA